MPQHDLDIANGSGAAVRADINSALIALGSTMKGPNAPSPAQAGEQWVEDDTPSATVWSWRIYDGTDWITCGIIDTVNNRFAPAIAGNLGVGTNSPAVDLHVLRSTAVSVEARLGNSVTYGSVVLTSAGDVYLFSPSANLVGFTTNNVERARIDSSGNILIGKVNAGLDTEDGFLFTNDGFAKGIRNTDGAIWQFIRSGSIVGSITVTSTATSYNTSSDPRLKRDVRDMSAEEAAQAIARLRPRMGAFLVEPDAAPLRPMFLAPELQRVIPHAVTGEAEQMDDLGRPVMQSAQYDPTLPVVVRALQDALARIEALEKQVRALTSPT